VRRAFDVHIGQQTAQQLKVELGAALPTETLLEMDVRGRSARTGMPVNVIVTSDDVQQAISEIVDAIVEAIAFTLEETAPELAADIMTEGIVLTGGAAQIKGLDALIRNQTGIMTYLVENPMHSVVAGAGKIAEGK